MAVTKQDAIVIEKEVLITEVRGSPNSIIQTKDGSFVIAGSYGWGAAWAVRTDAVGKVLWKYEEPKDPSVKSEYQSLFNGVVRMQNGAVMFCGLRATNDGNAGLIKGLSRRSTHLQIPSANAQ